MFYNSIRSTSKEHKKSNSLNPREKLINVQKREKLKGLLITKFMKKYGIKNVENILQQEISKFLEGEVLSDADLKRLDEKLRKILHESQENENLKRNLASNALVDNQNNLEEKSTRSEVILPDLNKVESMSVYSKNSKMSGASHLSKFNEKGANQAVNYEDELDLLSESSRKPIKRFDFSNEGDEWNAICQFNRKKYEEEKKLNKIKDWELKRRTKEDLDNQIRQKLNRINDEQLKNREYDHIQYNHTLFMNDVERQKQIDAKNKILKEKENRDKQMKDEKLRKRIELVKEKKYDKELGKKIKYKISSLVKHLLAEIEKEKNQVIKKKMEEKLALQKTLKDNELNKLKQLELLKKEKEDDIRAGHEYGKILEKQENERIEYFRKIERNAHGYMTNAVEDSLKEIEMKNKEEEEKIRHFLIEKEKRDQEDEEKKKILAWQSKMSMKNFLDMQVEEKKKISEFEKNINSEQARIWNTDAQRFFDQEKEINEKVRQSHVFNNGHLKDQIEFKKSRKTGAKMSDSEYALNRNILESIKSS